MKMYKGAIKNRINWDSLLNRICYLLSLVLFWSLMALLLIGPVKGFFGW